VPEAQEGGPIALVKDGDEIEIDAEVRELNLLISENEMEARRQQFKAPALKYEKGTLYKYARNVVDASRGCITDAPAE
jgi:dihydroxy-acid dehydratase